MIDSIPDPPELEASSLAANEFSRVRRGLEPTEVRAMLGRTADALRTWEQRDQHLQATIERLRSELEESRQLDESRIATVLGEETARIVTAARDAAADIRSKAEEEAEELRTTTEQQATAAAEALRSEAAALRDEAARRRDEAAAAATRRLEEAEAAAAATLDAAETRAEELLASAGSVLDERTAEAEAAAAELTAAADARVEDARASAAAIRATAEAEANAVVERARDDGREMLDEVRAVRERMLRDLAERRRAARRQLEAALAGRDRIVEVLGRAGAEVAATIESLDRVDDEAEAAAEAAVASVRTDAAAELAELLDEVGAGPLRDEPVTPPVVAVVEVEPARPSPAASEADPVVETAAPADEEASADVAVGDHADDAAEDDADGRIEDDGGDHTAEDAEDDPRNAGDAADEVADDADDAEVADDPDEDDASDGATVHDLFERLRTEVPEDPAAEDTGADDPDDAASAEDGADAEDTTVQEANGSEGPAADDADVVSIDLTETSAEQALLDRRDALLAPVEKQLSRVLKRVASDEQNEILDRLRRVKRGRPDPAELLPEEGSTTVWADALREEFATAVEVGAGFWTELAGPGPTAVPAGSETDTLLNDRLEAFLALHRAHLERAVVEADEQGLDASELGDRVRATYRDWRSSSLAEFAGDLAIAGFAHGERRAAGPGTPWRWVVDNGGLPCADGEDNALAGAVGCEQPFPTGDLTPPAHPGCRCILAPVAH